MTKLLLLILCYAVVFSSAGLAQVEYETPKKQFDTPQAGYEDHRARSPFRDLLPPADSEVGRSSGGSSGPDHEEFRLQVHSRLLAVDVLRHYGGQLTQKGWEHRSETVDGSIAFSTWRVEGDDGAEFHALLLAADGVREVGNVNLSLRLTRVLGW